MQRMLSVLVTICTAVVPATVAAQSMTLTRADTLRFIHEGVRGISRFGLEIQFTGFAKQTTPPWVSLFAETPSNRPVRGRGTAKLLDITQRDSIMFVAKFRVETTGSPCIQQYTQSIYLREAGWYFQGVGFNEKCWSTFDSSLVNMRNPRPTN